MMDNTFNESFDLDETSPDMKLIPTKNERYALVLKKLPNTELTDSYPWTLGVLDVEKCCWIVEALPFRVPGEDAVRIKDNGWIECYGLDKTNNTFFLFRFDCDVIGKYKLKVSVHDFSHAFPERVVWDEEHQFWRAVVNGVVIQPRAFYFDNTYDNSYPIESKEVSSEVLRLLHKSGE